jgi:hypothetical protein
MLIDLPDCSGHPFGANGQLDDADPAARGRP